MNIKKLFVSTVLACSMTASILFTNMGISNNTIVYADEKNTSKEPINVAKRSIADIKQYIKNHPANLSDSVTYSETPNAESPYNIGKLSNETLQSGINTLNHIRYIAGLSDITLNDTYNEKGQAASVVIAADTTSILSHYPKKPSDMSDAIYQLGANGAMSSNIAWGSRYNYTLNDCIVNGWMDDGDPSNIKYLGHRRWILNPSMGATGLGAVLKSKAPNTGTYLAMYAFDKSNTKANEYGVSWPAQTMPVEYFGTDYPWSISFGVSISENTTVKLTNNKTGEVWNFSKNSSDGDFYISNDRYGQIGCVIFRPSDDLSYKSGDSYRVEISNLGNPDIKNEASYNVNFFSLNDDTCANDESIPHTYGNWEVVKTATCSETGLERRICSVCKKEETKTIPLISHTYGEWVTVKEPTETENGSRQRTCTICRHIETQILYPESNEKYGDVNRDGKVNSSDAVILKKYLAQMDVFCDKKLADVNHDENITSSDAVILLKYLAGYDVIK